MKSRSMGVVLAVGVLAGCQDGPSGPDAFPLPAGTYQSRFTAVQGTGIGGLSVTPVAAPSQAFDVIVKIRLEGARPNTTYLVQRAAEIGRDHGADGICQRALAQAPWSAADPPAPAFVTFPQPTSPGPLVSFTTLGNGNGSIDFEYTTPAIAPGTTFDVMFRLVDDPTAPIAELRTGCFTVTSR